MPELTSTSYLKDKSFVSLAPAESTCVHIELSDQASLCLFFCFFLKVNTPEIYEKPIGASIEAELSLELSKWCYTSLKACEIVQCVLINTCKRSPQTCCRAVSRSTSDGSVRERTDLISPVLCPRLLSVFLLFLSNETTHYFFIQLLNLDRKWSFPSALDQKTQRGPEGPETARDWWGREAEQTPFEFSPMVTN